MPVFHGKISQIDILEPNRSLEIKGLVPYTTYGVIISAFTEGGIGVPSKHKKGGWRLVALFDFLASNWAITIHTCF